MLCDFELIERIGKGSFAKVYKVRRKADDQIYALKKVNLGKMKIKEKENAMNEIRILASVKHQNIIRYKECFIDTENLAIVMEFAGGGDLSHIIHNCKKHHQRVPETDVCRYHENK